MATDPREVIVDQIIEKTAIKAGDKAFGADDDDDVMIPLFKGHPFAEKVVLICASLLGGGPIFLAMRLAKWSKKTNRSRKG